MTRKRTITVLLDEHAIAELDALAAAEGVARADVVRTCLAMGLEVADDRGWLVHSPGAHGDRDAGGRRMTYDEHRARIAGLAGRLTGTEPGSWDRVCDQLHEAILDYRRETKEDRHRAVMRTERDLRDMMVNAVLAFDRAAHTGAEGDRVAWLMDATWLAQHLGPKAEQMREEWIAWRGDE